MRRLMAWLLFSVTAAWSGAIVAAPIAVGQRAGREPGGPVSVAASMVYVVGRVICHQRPERSFYAGAIRFPVCARCTGLYLAAPIGVLATLFWRLRAQRATAPAAGTSASAPDAVRWWRIALLVAAVPTALSLGIEWIGGPTSGVSRFLTALPLGATVAALAAAAALGLDRASATLTSRQ